MSLKQGSKYFPRDVNHSMHLPPQDGAVKKRWTLADMKYMLAHHKDMYIDDIALHLGRTTKAAQDKAFLMGCSFKTKTSE
jgi:hypothetical protein